MVFNLFWAVESSSSSKNGQDSYALPHPQVTAGRALLLGESPPPRRPRSQHLGPCSAGTQTPSRSFLTHTPMSVHLPGAPTPAATRFGCPDPSAPVEGLRRAFGFIYTFLRTLTARGSTSQRTGHMRRCLWWDAEATASRTSFQASQAQQGLLPLEGVPTQG